MIRRKDLACKRRTTVDPDARKSQGHFTVLPSKDKRVLNESAARMALYRALSAFLPTVALASSSKLLGNQLSHCKPRSHQKDIVPETVHCFLTFDVVNFTVAGVGNITTRGYQRNDTDRSAATPIGPTINAYPGDNLTIELFNNLHQPLLRQRGVHNFYHDFEWTNVHTHRRCPPSPVPKQSLPCAESI